MSDILDALRKAELQRSTPGVPGITTRQRYVAASARRSWPRTLLLLVALLFGAGVSGALATYLARHGDDAILHPSLPPETRRDIAAQPAVAPHSLPPDRRNAVPLAPPAPPIARPQTPQPSRPAVVATQSGAAEDGGEKEGEAPPSAPESTPEKGRPASPFSEEETDVAVRRNSSVPLPTKSVPRLPPPQTTHTTYNTIPSAGNPLNQIPPPASVEVKEFSPRAPVPLPRARHSSAGSGYAPLLTTLSYQYQSMVPKMTVNAQVYSRQAAERFVVINMKRYAEGQQTAGGVTVEAIRQDDIIFKYQGQRFRLAR